MTCSARSFALASNAARPAAVAARVPLIGRVIIRPAVTSTRVSGEAQPIAHPSPVSTPP
ncbi:hypothetical protein HCB18_09560 [Salinispora arenicola]|nr:hypothetical protein [Salinispora arenicola]